MTKVIWYRKPTSMLGAGLQPEVLVFLAEAILPMNILRKLASSI